MATDIAMATSERPPRLVFVYTWDIIRAVLALLAALSAFAGGYEVHGKAVALPLWEQIAGGVGSAAYAAALIVVAALLARREMWVRKAQLLILLLSAAMIAASVIPAATSADLLPLLLSAAAFLALDAAAVYSLTREDAHRWYIAPTTTPRYMTACVALWLAGSLTLLIVETFQ